ncbi:BTAD domain-containing putative transcriptional regulator [Nocardia sp. NPDC050697]|uniref:BTAD domain-containing putative transcriptional regulator n=1 Tax=Nocardia sp. NPDC050697 TaxID=3155158 RepID=UPI0033D156DD
MGSGGDRAGSSSATGAGRAAWALAPRTRRTELRLHAVERLAGARIDLSETAFAAAELDAHVLEPPWREEAGAAGGLITADPVATHLATLGSATPRDRAPARL